MSPTVLGGEGRGIGEGTLSRPFEPPAQWSRATVIRGGPTSPLRATSQPHSQSGADINVIGEDIRCTFDRKVMRGVEKALGPAITSMKQFARQARFSGANLFDKGQPVTWGSQVSRREYYLKDIYPRASLYLDRRVRPAVSAAVSPYVQRRVTGPVQFMTILLKTWELKPDDAAPLLGFEQSDRVYVRGLLSGRFGLAGRDVKDRIAHLLHIRMTLASLFRSEDVENQWLREEHAMLANQTPLQLLLDGGMENLLLVKEYVDAAAGR